VIGAASDQWTEPLHYGGGVSVERPDRRETQPRARSHRALLWSVLLALLVVVAAGTAGTTRFAGPRWVPDWKLPTHTQPPPRFRAPSLARLPRMSRLGHAGTFPLWIVLWVAVAVVVVGIAVLLWRLWAGRPSRAETGPKEALETAMSEIPIEPEPEPDTPALRTGIELALQVLDEQREPADAIVRAWLGLQETAAESGIVRRAAETPTEFTTRILSRAFADDRAVRTLLRLYLRTRFGDHPVTTDDVASVRAALQELVRTWPAPEVPAGAGPR
jgi:flagellar basal body-associated protein FliL